MRILTKFLLIFLFTSFGLALWAQTLRSVPASIKFENANRPCVLVTLEPSEKEVKDAWKNFLDDEYNVRLRGGGIFTNSDLMKAENINFGQITQQEINLYTHFYEYEQGTEMCVFASLGEDFFIDRYRNPQAYYALERVVDNFVDDYVPRYYQERVEAAQKRIRDLEKDLEDARENIQDNEEEINDLQEENRELSMEIDRKTTDLLQLQQTLRAREDNLQEVRRRIQDRKRYQEK